MLKTLIKDVWSIHKDLKMEIRNLKDEVANLREQLDIRDGKVPQPSVSINNFPVLLISHGHIGDEGQAFIGLKTDAYTDPETVSKFLNGLVMYTKSDWIIRPKGPASERKPSDYKVLTNGELFDNFNFEYSWDRQRYKQQHLNLEPEIPFLVRLESGTQSARLLCLGTNEEGHMVQAVFKEGETYKAYAQTHIKPIIRSSNDRENLRYDRTYFVYIIPDENSAMVCRVQVPGPNDLPKHFEAVSGLTRPAVEVTDPANLIP